MVSSANGDGQCKVYPPGWLMLDDIQQAAYDYLKSHAGHCISTEEIARAIGRSETGELPPLLRNMVRRAIVECVKNQGFRCPLTESQE
jgi:hypothetical protein